MITIELIKLVLSVGTPALMIISIGFVVDKVFK